MATAFGTTFTTAVGVVDRVHRGAADVGSTSEPSSATGFSEDDIHMIAVSNDADDGAAGARNATDFTARQVELSPIFFASDEGRFGAGGTAHASAATGTNLDIVNGGTKRNLAERQAVSNAGFSGVAADDLHTDGQTFGRDDIALDAVFVDEERNARGAVRIVLDGVDSGDHTVLIATEVDETDVSFVSAAAVAHGDHALIIATATALFRAQQAFLRLRAFGQLGEVANAHVSPTSVIRSIFSNTHLLFSQIDVISGSTSHD